MGLLDSLYPIKKPTTEEKYLAQRRMRGVSDMLFGAGDLLNTVLNTGIQDVDYFTGGKLSGGTYDPKNMFQFKMPSQAVADFATNVTGANIVPESAVSPETAQKGANQQALVSMIPTGAEDLAGPLLVGAKGLSKMGGLLDEVAKVAPDAAKAMPSGGLLGDVAKTVDNTVGDLKNADVMFEGVSPRDFTDTAQWHRFGKQYGVENLGSPDAAAWEKSLVPYKSKSGKEFTIPGGVDSKEPFTYYDLLHLKKQGINPNDMDPLMHQKIHDRMLTTMSSDKEMTPERMMNQLILAQISPNQPLTPNELAVARTMVKGPEDLEKLGSMIPWNYADDNIDQVANEVVGTHMVKDKKTGEMVERPITRRQQLSSEIANKLGLGSGGAGGLGARGTADYTRIAETAQRMQADPDFFRFRGAGEGGATSAEQWANFVERLSNQTPGLSAKTGSFGAVWQDPKGANISAVDRHMAGKFKKEMFPSEAEYNEFAAKSLDKFNKGKDAADQVTDFDKLPDAFRNDQMFGYLNRHPTAKYRLAPGPGSNSGVGAVSAKVPEHLKPENAQWVKEPEEFRRISEPYRRVLEANANEANKAGQSIFGSQWMLWDRIRNRLEPHEIMFPGLEKLPRMSMSQMHGVRQDLADAGYMASTKAVDELADTGKKLKPVRPLPSASRAAYFGFAPLGLLPLLADQEDKPGPTRKKAAQMRGEL